ncbi:adenylate cyclase associated N terminal-domain-containing protein [Aspergillus californicus]
MAATSHMHNLTTLIKRLEAATSRLEDMAMPLDDHNAQKSPESPKSPEQQPSEHPTPTGPPAPTYSPLPPQIEDFDTLIKKDVGTFVDLGKKIGGLVEEQANAVLQAFKAERTYLYVSTKAKKPDLQPPALMTELHTASDIINNIRESNRASPLFDHLSAVAEGIVTLGWFFEPKPADFVNEMLGGIQYYGNKVLKEYKEKDRTHYDYIQAYYQIFKSLASYLRNHYPKGLTWNDKDGIDAQEALKQAKGSSSPGASSAAAAPPPLPTLNIPGGGGGAPPPPPPPPPPPMIPEQNASAGSSSDMTAVFAQLNQGDNVTQGLRKVDKSEMTHKNPDLRSSSIVPESPTSRSKSPAPSKKPKPQSMRSRKPPRKDLEGSKWFVENFDNPGEIVEIPAKQNQSILISRCNKTIIKVSGKANAIAMDNCQGLSLIVDSLVSSLDAVKCSKFALQIDGFAPTLLLDQVDGATIYLSQHSLETEVFSSKCTAVNILLPPKEGTDEDTKECPLPEQIKTYIKDGVLYNEIVAHAG